MFKWLKFNVDIQQSSLLYYFLRKIMTALDQLQTDVTANRAAIDQAVGLMNQLSKQIADLVAAAQSGNGVTDAQLADLSTQVQAATKTLTDASAANTMGAQPPTA